MHAVAADDPFRCDHPRLTALAQGDADSALVLLDRIRRHAATNSAAELPDALREYRLRHVLGQHQQVGVCRRQALETERQQRPITVANGERRAPARAP